MQSRTQQLGRSAKGLPERAYHPSSSGGLAYRKDRHTVGPGTGKAQQQISYDRGQSGGGARVRLARYHGALTLPGEVRPDPAVLERAPSFKLDFPSGRACLLWQLV
jgi:hypothetical protein